MCKSAGDYACIRPIEACGLCMCQKRRIKQQKRPTDTGIPEACKSAGDYACISVLVSMYAYERVR